MVVEERRFFFALEYLLFSAIEIGRKLTMCSWLEIPCNEVFTMD